MANRKWWLGMLVMVLAFGLLVSGCDLHGGDYTFEFKVHMSSSWIAPDSFTIEFINGSNRNDSVLHREEIVGLSEGEMTGVIKVSGFSNKQDNDKRIFGVKITDNEGTTYFRWDAAEDRSKVRVLSNGSFGLFFYRGDW